VNLQSDGGEGSAVLEDALRRGLEHEMVTLYYMEARTWRSRTIVCSRTGPTCARRRSKSSPDKIVFKCREGGKTPRSRPRITCIRRPFTFVDADHLTTEWVLYKDGKSDSTHSFDLTRKKESESEDSVGAGDCGARFCRRTASRPMSPTPARTSRSACRAFLSGRLVTMRAR